MTSAHDSSTYSNPMYHTLHSPTRRSLRCGSAPPRGCRRMTPDGQGAHRKTPEELAPKPHFPARLPRRCSRNSQTQTCTSGLRLLNQQRSWGKPCDLCYPVVTGHSPVTQAVKSDPHATCRMAFPWSFSTLFGCRYDAWSPCPSWPTILAPLWTFCRQGWGGVCSVKHVEWRATKSLVISYSQPTCTAPFPPSPLQSDILPHTHVGRWCLL